jgi:hypothetical protein
MGGDASWAPGAIAISGAGILFVCKRFCAQFGKLSIAAVAE